MNCAQCAHLNEENVRQAFVERKPLSGGSVEMVEHWRDTVSKEGKPAVRAVFVCRACGQTHDIVVEITGEPDPANWWKA